MTLLIPTDFARDLAASQKNEGHPAVLAAFKACFPDALQVHRAHQQNDKLGVDFWLEYPGAYTRRIDVKIRSKDYGAMRGRSMDVVLELSFGNRPGWAMKENATDHFLFVCLDTGRAVAFLARDLRMALKANHNAWVKQYQVITTSTVFELGKPAVESVALAVPADVLQAAIAQLHVPVMPDDFNAAAYAFEHDAWGSF